MSMTRGAKMLMLRNEGNRGGQGGNRGARNEMENAYMRGESGSGGRNEMRNEMRNESGSGGRNEMRGGYGGEMEVENRFRDRRGREHYDNGRFAPMRNEGGSGGGMRYNAEMGYESEMRGNYEMENRRGGRGRARSEYEGPQSEEEYWPPFPPPIYEGGGSGGAMNRIGFEQPSNVLMLPVGNMGGKSGGMEMANQPRSHTGFTQEMAEEWVMAMQNEDGTKGPHWKMEDVQRLMKQRGIKYDPYEFWAVLNGVYSDYCAVAKKHGVNTMDFYVDFASAWINDKDAVPNKTAMYYECIAK